MSALSIQPTYPIFTDIDGQPLEAGYVWIGTANLDPQTNPITVYWDAALTILAPQPIRTLAGYPSNNGTPARLYVNSDYSIRVMNKNGSTVYSAPTATERYSDAVISAVNAEDVIYDPPFLGGVQTNVEAKLAQTVSVKDFGAMGDGVTDDTAAIQAAVDYADNNLLTIKFPAGVYCISSTVNVSVNPVGFVGEYDAVWQQGSTLPSVTLRWTGGASSMFNLAVSNVYFEGMAVENTGTATDFVSLGVIRYRFKRMSFLVRSGATAFSRAIIYALGNRLGYSEFSGIQMGSGAAPYFIYIDGNGSPNGCTPISFSDRCIFESGTHSPLTVLYIKDEVFDAISIDNCTFNQQGGELTIIDTTDSPLPQTIRALTLTNIEWDYTVANNTATDKALKLENVINITIVGGNWQCGGVTSCISLTNCTVADLSGNYIRSTATFINADSASIVKIGYNDVDVSNVGKIVNDVVQGIINVPWVAGNVILLGQKGLGSGHTTYVISPSSGGWTLTYRHGSLGYFVPGQIITVQVKNASGGTISAGTPVAAFKTTGAFVAPADGFSRFYTFVFTGSVFMEISRSAADVPN
jgi:hypothetical protein